jgi:hypothetical protein
MTANFFRLLIEIDLFFLKRRGSAGDAGNMYMSQFERGPIATSEGNGQREGVFSERSPVQGYHERVKHGLSPYPAKLKVDRAKAMPSTTGQCFVSKSGESSTIQGT